jgi:tRNA(adenine34) deaminase
MQDNDIIFMKEAIKEAEKAYRKGEVPIGAIVVKDGAIIGRGHNETESRRDATAHGEMNAIKNAEQNLNSRRLNGCVMYVTSEPCTMCAGAIVLTRIDRLVTGANSPKSGACYTLKNLLCDERLNHTVELTKNVLDEECGSLLSKFFGELRSGNYKQARH